MSAERPAPSSLQLGTFLGVFTPTILTILGVIMYMRVGWVVGNAGLLPTLAIVLLAHVITIVTSLSVASLATNMKVGVGGAYYIISRSLGLEFGGAIGLPLFLSQALSVTLYSYGLAEAVAMVWPAAPIPYLAAGIIIVVSLVAMRSTMLALKLQLPIMVLVAFSVISLFAGADWGGTVAFRGTYPDASFWEVFAVFFPAVTGIMVGLPLSGDLKDPDRAIPLGTLTAVGVGLVVYLAIPVALGLSATEEALRTDSLVWMSVAAVPVLVMPGLCGAILSSAVGSVLSAPRTLQALADDGLVSARFGNVNERGEPVLALIATASVALLAVLLGDLNAVAGVVSMFFLTTYGMINVICGLEGLIQDPSFRPRFRIHWAAPLLCAIACFGVMFLINAIASVVAISVCVGVYLYLSRRALASTFGDIRGGALVSLARYALARRGQHKTHARSWRPHILVFSSEVERSLGLIRLAIALSQERGVVTVATLLVGDVDEIEPPFELQERSRTLLDENRLLAFHEVDVVPELESGIVTVAQANGMAGLTSNTVMFGWPVHGKALLPAVRTMRRLTRLHKSLLIARYEDRPLPSNPELVVWWSGKEENGDLMLLLAHLLTLNRQWRRARIRLASIVASEADVGKQRDALQALVRGTRIAAEPEIIVRSPNQTITELIHKRSAATLVFLGLNVPDHGSELEYAERVEDMVSGLDNVILVRNAGPYRGELL